MNETTNIDRASTLTEVSSEVLNESTRSLLLINGGGAVAVATWLQAVWSEPWASSMLRPQVLGIGLWSYAVFIDGRAWSLAEDMLRSLGTCSRREEFYDGTSIRVSPKGELLCKLPNKRLEATRGNPLAPQAKRYVSNYPSFHSSDKFDEVQRRHL